MKSRRKTPFADGIVADFERYYFTFSRKHLWRDESTLPESDGHSRVPPDAAGYTRRKTARSVAVIHTSEKRVYIISRFLENIYGATSRTDDSRAYRLRGRLHTP